MPSKIKLMKTKWYPQPHRNNLRFKLSAQVANKQATIVPLCFYDEGLGSPSDQETNPRNAAFATVNRLNCFVESRIDLILGRITLSLTKAALETDKVTALSVGYMPIFVSFDDYTAIDELSSSEIQDILELQFETTDNQGYPLYAGTKLTEAFSGIGTVSSCESNSISYKSVSSDNFILGFSDKFVSPFHCQILFSFNLFSNLLF